MSVKIHGKDYITVDERVNEFHNRYENGKIESELILNPIIDSEIWIIKTIVTPDVDKPERTFTGYAYERESSSQINKTSALENCETSAVGRALGFLNIGLSGSIATADEVANAIHQQSSKPSKAVQQEAEDSGHQLPDHHPGKFMESKFAGKCEELKVKIDKGEDILYLNGKVYCAASATYQKAKEEANDD